MEVRSLGLKRVGPYTIVQSHEASPKEGRISVESPLGRALIGRKEGETIEYITPSGTQEIQVISVN